MKRRGPVANDCYTAEDWRAAGLISRCDTGLVCGHMIDPRQSVWPVCPNGDGAYYRMEAH